VQRRVSSRGGLMVARQKIHAGMIHAGKSATVICENNHFRVVIDGETAAVVPRTTTSEIHRHKANATDKRTDCGREERRECAQRQRRARPVQESREAVASERIGTEQQQRRAVVRIGRDEHASAEPSQRHMCRSVLLEPSLLVCCVCSLVSGLAARLLGAHIGGRSENDAVGRVTARHG